MMEQQSNYAHLPEDLIYKILNGMPATVEKMNRIFTFQQEPVDNAIARLRGEGIVKTLLADDVQEMSLIAADGGHVIEHMSGTDILLAVAVGVEGLRPSAESGWSDDSQYDQWQTVIPHDEDVSRLCQGVMFLMELSVLANANHQLRIMDGAHFSPIIRVNSMMSTKGKPEYAQVLEDFLRETYDKIIPDIPNIIAEALNNPAVVAMPKYSSSRDLLDSHVKDDSITLDDRTFFTVGLSEGEHTRPLPVGQSNQERQKTWNDLHIKCNLKVPEQEELNEHLEKILLPIRTKGGGEKRKESKILFTYYKPHQEGLAYRIEMKKELAEDEEMFSRALTNIKRQIVYPDIREPFPQYLADLMAKSVGGGLRALQDAIRLSPKLKLRENPKHFNLLLPYRS